VAPTDAEMRTANIAETSSTFAKIWQIAAAEDQAKDSPVIMGFLASLN